jgi:hypothetical protein
MTEPGNPPDDDPVREDFIQEIPVWEVDHATDFHPQWEPRFEEEIAEPEPEAPPPKEPPFKPMGVRLVARSADGLTVVNTLEILPPFDFSV